MRFPAERVRPLELRTLGIRDVLLAVAGCFEGFSDHPEMRLYSGAQDVLPFTVKTG
jgi:hypothetical protein